MFSDANISQGSVATRLSCGAIFNDIVIANFLLNVTVKELCKSVNIWRSYGQEFGVLFFLTHSVECRVNCLAFPSWTQSTCGVLFSHGAGVRQRLALSFLLQFVHVLTLYRMVMPIGTPFLKEKK